MRDLDTSFRTRRDGRASATGSRSSVSLPILVASRSISPRNPSSTFIVAPVTDGTGLP
ncbi:hypothetical protein [Lysobacter gummosus]|uniref:hypothetical protein n=1 Tax=Lysobacter gummosus TaxID=262324 RepID=UPI0036322DBB